ncbi:MAG: response regulator [Anaerolineaceae bacterium]|nr:MAG: response regulator [Anaerolineaceae bacterium]
MRIIVIEDEKNTRKSLIGLIKQLDNSFDVIGEADNGLDGMMLIKTLRPDVVITDIVMPRIEGLDMIEQLGPSAENIHFLVISGYADFELAKRAVRLPVTDYLLKPITVEQLLKALKNIESQINRKTENTENEDSSEYSDITNYICKSIEKNFNKNLYLEDLAHELKITPEYAGNVFKKEYGQSFSAALGTRRISEAKKLLKSTNHKIYEVAFMSGYTDVQYFCRVFKKYTGMSATQYARRNAKTMP